MPASRLRPTLTAVLLLATLAFAGVASDLHEHHGPVAAHGFEDQVAFSGGHHEPDPTRHVEGATRIDARPCVGCLVRDRQQADVALAPSFGGAEPSSTAGVRRSDRRDVRDLARLPASRAPPRA